MFIGISGRTDKTDNRAYEILYDNFTCKIFAFQPIAKFMKMDTLFRLKKIFIM